MQKNRNEFFQLVIVGMMVVGLFFSFALLPSVGHGAEVRFENCQPGTWVGGVKWEWGAAGKGVYQGSTYIDIPEIELKGVGSIVVDLELGDYAITHYRPQRSGYTEAGRPFFYPSAVLDFREIAVDENSSTHYFGCD